MSEGKCEDCGIETKIGKDGKPYEKCWPCRELANDEKKKTKTEQASEGTLKYD